MECAVTTKWNNISLRHANITNIIDNTYWVNMGRNHIRIGLAVLNSQAYADE